MFDRFQSLFSNAFAAAAVLTVAVGTGSALAAQEQVTRTEAVRFLKQASFGPTGRSIAEVQRYGYGGWLEKQFEQEGHSARERMAAHAAAKRNPRRGQFHDYFWEQALYAPDQLRVRTMFALSQIVVVATDDVAFDAGSFANYVDMLRRASFGNYCTLIREVTYSPMMADYLTYFKNVKADPRTGRAPDENYAREIMQLFTIGLEELNLDGTPKGKETYTSDDVEGLASVFTGLATETRNFHRARISKDNGTKPLVGHPAYHEPGPKTFLGATIPGGLKPEESVDQALDHLLQHPNIAPFIAKQMIQKFVTSNPSPDYVRRVARVFNAGEFRMPSGRRVGTGERCDMQATMAALLLDREARSPERADDPAFGKVREPVLRLAHLMRVLSDDDAVVPYQDGLTKHPLLNTENAVHNQLVFSPPSVFGFYRPGYVAAGTRTASAGLLAPEMQIMTSDHVMAQTAFLSKLLRPKAPEFLQRDTVRWMTLAQNPQALVDRMTALLLDRPLNRETYECIIAAVDTIGLNGPVEKQQARALRRVQVAAMMVMTTPQYVVQK